ncbi:hypothetical protein [Methylocella tundrae]|uniref:Secreted protein n=1 Tax=Methylocella tundrae TaxID=227605 RepID=A0A4U8YZ13_METTU|nr:hypothetical protein [Methylocella tundrae]WPP06177.1 hypothetical protein SIN04_10385 [Methylocella tundrae]VFU08810.1 exported protein of unknown function [Methylocella tundrae]
MNRPTVCFALWFVAVLAAAIVLVPVSASAHPGHRDSEMVSHRDQQTIDITSPKTLAGGQISPVYAVFSQAVRDLSAEPTLLDALPEHGSCQDECCCSGMGCCFGVSVPGEAPIAPLFGAGAKYSVSPPVSARGITPASLLEPPNAFV